MPIIKCKICNQDKKYKKSYLNKNKNYGIFCSRKCQGIDMVGKKRPELRESKLGDKNPIWKGDDVGYNALHARINRNFKKPEKCQDCKINPAYDLANISQKYKTDISDWEWLCRRCHMIKDGRMEKFKELTRLEKLSTSSCE